ncbi:MAG: putative transposase [Nitriliruptoraceae bacterium]
MGQTMLAPLREMEPPLPLSPACAVRVAPGVDLVEDPAEGGAVWLHGMVSFAWEHHDGAGRRLAAAGLVATGAASQRQVAAAFGVNETTVWRWRQERDRAGVAGLVSAKKGPRGPWKLTDELAAQIVALSAQQLSGRQIARRLDVSEGSVRRVLTQARERDAASSTAPETAEATACDEVDLAEATAAGETADPTEADDATDGLKLLARPQPRTSERQAARAGLLAGAPPKVCEGGQLPAAGVLLALPGLQATGLLDTFEETFADRQGRAAFYDTRALVLTVALSALLGEPRAQGLTRLAPTDLGRLLGYDRGPEVKTLRRRLGELAGLSRSDVLLETLAARHLTAHPDQAGMFYIDGHVRAYHGKADLSKAHVARMRISMPAEVDTWITDARGDGLLVWTSEPGASLTGELRRATGDIRKLVGDDARPTIVFDRGGWSPKLFAELDTAGFDILTYRKNPPAPEPASAFVDHTVVDDRGATHTYRLADRPVRLGYGPKTARRYFSCRQIVRLCDTGHQTTIVTTRTDVDPGPIAWAMFNRWREENFFRYMRARFALDALDTYTIVPDDPARTVPNPAKKDAARHIAALKATIASGQATIGRLADTPALAPSLTELSGALDEVRDQLATTQADNKVLPARVPVGDIRPDAARLDGEHKRLVDAIRMATYNAESSLARLLSPHYRRAHHEARSLLHEAFASPADIQIIDGRMHVTLNPLSAPHRTRAIAGLCRDLTDTETLYPGTDHPLVYTVKNPDDSA